MRGAHYRGAIDKMAPNATGRLRRAPITTAYVALKIIPWMIAQIIHLVKNTPPPCAAQSSRNFGSGRIESALMTSGIL